jgi:hypothetical protein
VADLHCPVKGTWSPHSQAPFEFPVHQNVISDEFDRHGGWNRGMGGLPKINFPVFDGSSPKLWQKQCEDYFYMYATEEIVWVKVATMHFQGVAARWLQSVEHQLSSLTWRQFFQYVHDRFGRERHELVIRKLFHIRQTTSVQDYTD